MAQTTTEWAKDNGIEYQYSVILDAYTPPRNVSMGTLWTYAQTRILEPGCRAYDEGKRTYVQEGMVLEDVSELKDARNSLYLVSFPEGDINWCPDPTAYYVAGWRESDRYLLLHPVGGNFNTPYLGLSPRRCYHLVARTSGR